MKLNKDLNLVIPLKRDNFYIYAYSTPISKDVYDSYFLVMAKALTMCYSAGSLIAPRIAAKCIKKVAKDMSSCNDDDKRTNTLDVYNEVMQGLFAEIYRLTNIYSPSDNGWTLLPIELALRQGVISKDEFSEVEDEVCFFMLVSCLHKKSQIEGMLQGVCRLWECALSPLSFTEYVGSLPIVTPPETTQQTLSSVIS